MLDTTTWQLDQKMYQEIADNARDALDCPGVQVYLYSAARDELHVVAWSGLNLYSSKRAEAFIRFFYPGFAPLKTRNSGSLNRYLIGAYHHGETQVARFSEVAQNAAPRLAVWLASIFAGMRQTIIVPIQIDGVVVASISFSQTPKFSQQNIRTCQAFGRQTALLLENTVLSSRLATQLQELATSRKMLSENEERLRREIAELLHTRVQTRLLVAWHRLGEYAHLSDPAAQQALITQVQAELEECRENDVRDASQMLHPAVIKIGLVPAVRSLAARVGSVLTIKLHCNEALTALDQPILNQLPEALRLVAYRVIEEALANTLRHAKATRVEISLAVVAHQLEICVTDNGVGFDSSQSKMGLGLSSLEARVLTAGGTWEICSVIGQRTELKTVLPL